MNSMDFPSTRSGGAPPTIPQDALVTQKQEEAVLIWTIGAFCILGWEFILCFPDEYKLIWRKPMNISSLLYLSNRYFGLVEFCLVVSLATDVWTPSACEHIFFFEPISGLISTVISQMILGGRVYAIFSQNKAIGLLLSLILLAEVVFSGMAISHISRLPPGPGPSSVQPPCGALMGPFEGLFIYWAVPLFYDTVAFLLTAWKAFDLWRKDLDTHLFEVIWRDGFLYFFAILAMNIANVIIFSTAPQILRSVNIAPTLIFQVIISCRLVLNLKGSQKVTTTPNSNSSQTKRSDDSRSVKVTVSKWSSSKEQNIVSHLDQQALSLRALQKVQTTEADVKNWSLPAHLWNNGSQWNMV